jgi:hypothetical protein
MAMRGRAHRGPAIITGRMLWHEGAFYMGVLLIMQYVCQKIGLASSAVILAGGVLAYLSEGAIHVARLATGQVVQVHTQPAVPPSVGEAGLKWAGVAFVTAIGSIVTPIAAAWLKGKYDVRFALQAQRLAQLKAEVDKVPSILQEAAEAKARAHEAELKAAKLEAEVMSNTRRLDTGRLELDELHQGVTEAKVEAKRASLSPVATLVCNHLGIILAASDQISFLMQWTTPEIKGKDVRIMIPDYLHIPFNEALRASLDPAVPMVPKVVRNFRALNKSGDNVFIDVRLTRWVEPGPNCQPPTVECMRFGALLREHRLGSNGDELFPDVDLTGTIASVPDH